MVLNTSITAICVTQNIKLKLSIEKKLQLSFSMTLQLFTVHLQTYEICNMQRSPSFDLYFVRH
jgi:hypothetical protein